MVACQNFRGCFARYAFFRAPAAGEVSPGELPGCPGTDPLHPQPTREDPEHLYSILDYKPDAGTNKPIAQLTIYALALTRLVPGLRLFDIKCAWFNEHEYCEFFPRTLFASH